MHKRILNILITAVILGLIAVLFTACGGDSTLSEEAETVSDRIEIQYNICETGGGRIEGWRTQHGAPGEEAPQTVTAVAKTGYRFVGWSDGVTDAERHDTFGDANCVITANFVYDMTAMPVLSIQTVTGTDVSSKTDYISCSVSLCNTGKTEFELCEEKAEIRGRGNATWTFDKKSYRIKFEHKQQLLGLGNGKSSSWVLMANQCDQSMLRNYLSIYMANLLDGIDYNSSGTFVEVYLNGNYRGVYLLAEQVEDGENRINLHNGEMEDPEAAECGFLVELDAYAQEPYMFWIGSKSYEVKSEVKNDAQFEYIRSYIEEVDSRLSEGDRDRIAEVFDIDSAVDGYILEEYFKNIDVGWSSIYMYKSSDPDDVLHFGPFWDFDLAAGNDHRLDNAGYKNIYVGADYGFSQSNRWFIRLMRCEWFRTLVAERWEEVRGVLDAVTEELDRVSSWGLDAFNRNYEVWPIFGQRINQEPERVLALRTYEEHVAYLREWLENRRAWLDTEFATYN